MNMIFRADKEASETIFDAFEELGKIEIKESTSLLELGFTFQDGEKLYLGRNLDDNSYFFAVNMEGITIREKILSEHIRIKKFVYKDFERDLVGIQFDNEYGLGFIGQIMSITFSMIQKTEKPALREDLFHIIDEVIKYFSKIRKKDIPEWKKIGIFAEIFTLHQLIQIGRNQDPMVHPEEVLERWSGPKMEEHDYWNGKTAIEVKGIGGKFDAITIHGFRQLSIPASNKLYLRVLRLEKRKDVNDGISLENLISDIIEQLDNNYHKEFSVKLARIMIDFSNLDKYQNWCYSVMFDRIYKVDLNFPRIDMSIMSQISHHDSITELEYKIQLEKLPIKSVDERTHNAILDSFVYNCISDDDLS